ncbi:XkdX family protein, partial [Clostridioides difficile]
WTKEQVKTAVEKNKITASEYKEITGEDYIV